MSFVSSVPGEQLAESGDSMKKARRLAIGEMRREYDFASLKGGVRGKYVKRLRAGTNVVLIDPELTAAFPTAAAVNEALRIALEMVAVVSSGRKRSNSAVQRTRRAAHR